MRRFLSIALAASLAGWALCGPVRANIILPGGPAAGAAPVGPIAWAMPFTQALNMMGLPTQAPDVRDILVVLQGLDLTDPANLALAEPVFARLEHKGLTPETFAKVSSLPPKDPMTCCVFVSRRLQELWKLQDPLRGDAPSGKMARFWREDAGIPDEDELDAIEKRSETLKRNIKTATCTVYPIRVGGESDKQCAADLVAMLNERGLGKAETSQTDPALKIAGHSNEQKVLWDTARAFREFVKKNPPATDYAVYADYGLYGSKVRYVHVIVCDRAGDWVLIDLQNSHHPDFQQIDPKTAADASRLLLTRLKSWLNE